MATPLYLPFCRLSFPPMDIMTSQTGGPDNSAGSKMWLRMLNVHNHWERVSVSISVVLIVSSVSFITFSVMFLT